MVAVRCCGGADRTSSSMASVARWAPAFAGATVVPASSPPRRKRRAPSFGDRRGRVARPEAGQASAAGGRGDLGLDLLDQRLEARVLAQRVELAVLLHPGQGPGLEDRR